MGFGGFGGHENEVMRNISLNVKNFAYEYSRDTTTPSKRSRTLGIIGIFVGLAVIIGIIALFIVL